MQRWRLGRNVAVVGRSGVDGGWMVCTFIRGVCLLRSVGFFLASSIKDNPLLHPEGVPVFAQF